MAETAPKTIGETRSRMYKVVSDFRAQASLAGTTEQNRLASRARRAIEQLRKQFKHKIDDMLRRDAKRHWGINEAERQGLQEQLRLAVEGSLHHLEQVLQDLGLERRDEPNSANDRPSV
jgi:hypothetical protein